MTTEDKALRAISANGHVRALVCTTTQLSNELQRKHGTWPVATAALGRTAAIAAMMGLMLKGNDRLTIQIKGEGPLEGILVDADANGNVRGYVNNPHVHLPSNSKGKLDVGGAIGPGMLYVIRDLGLKDVYRGSAELQTGEIADDFTYYFAVSEQTPSSVGAGVLVDTDNTVIVSGGFILQLLPGYTEADVAELEQRIGQLQSVTDILRTGATASDLLNLILPNAQVLEEKPLGFNCPCSRDRMQVMLQGLGKAELQSIIDDLGHAEVVCHFCNERYDFSKDDLEAMINA